MDKPRHGKPYVWVTWITGLLAGTYRCEWSAWYKAHFRDYAKFIKMKIVDGVRVPDFDVDAWTADHDKAVTLSAATLRSTGHVVGVEKDNAFTLHGEKATLGGKPDIFAVRGWIANVVDVKTGKERESDHWQVKTYLFALPRVLGKSAAGKTFTGTIEYPGGRAVNVPMPTAQEIAKIGSVMQMAGGDLEPARVPSREECSRCNILNCPVRDDSEPMTAGTTAF